MSSNQGQRSIEVIIKEIHPGSTYEGKVYDQYVLVAGESSEWIVFDYRLLVRSEHINQTCCTEQIAYLGHLERQSGIDRGLLVDKQKNVVEVSGRVIHANIHTYFDEAEPNFRADLKLDIGEGKMNCHLTVWCSKPEDFELANLEAGDYVKVFPNRIDLKSIVICTEKATKT